MTHINQRQRRLLIVVFIKNEYTKTSIENPEFKNVIIDSEEHVLYGEYKDGSKYQPDLTGSYNYEGAPFNKIVSYIIKKEF